MMSTTSTPHPCELLQELALCMLHTLPVACMAASISPSTDSPAHDSTLSPLCRKHFCNWGRQITNIAGVGQGPAMMQQCADQICYSTCEEALTRQKRKRDAIRHHGISFLSLSAPYRQYSMSAKEESTRSLAVQDVAAPHI